MQLRFTTVNKKITNQMCKYIIIIIIVRKRGLLDRIFTHFDNILV
jgi:hypothetical protein